MLVGQSIERVDAVLGGTGLSGRCTNPALTAEWLPGHDGLRVVGAVDVATSGEWDRILAAVAAARTPWRLDLTGLSFIDVRSVAALVDTARRLPARPLTLYRPPWCLRRILDTVWADEPAHLVVEDER